MKKVNYALGLLAFAAVTSCTDNTYDLSKDNMDWSLQAGEQGETLWMPAGNTANAQLKDLFSVNEGQNLKFIKDPESGREGLYCLEADGIQNATVTMSAPTSSWGATTIDETSTTVGLKDIPDFLRRDETCFDIINPIILVKVDKPAGVDLRSFIKMTIVKNGAETMIARTKNLDDFKVTGNRSGTNARKFYIAAQPLGDTQAQVDRQLPEEYSGATWIPLDETKNTLQEMLREMPDEFKMELEGYQGKGSGSVTLDVDYLFYAPMRPDKLFRLNDDDRADGFKSDLEDVLFDAILVKANVRGDLPMTVRIVPVAINENGQDLKDVKVTVNGKDYLEVPGDRVTPILVRMASTTGEKTSHYVKRDANYLDGIRFDFTMLTTPGRLGAKIFSDMMVRLDQMQLGAEGIGYDGN